MKMYTYIQIGAPIKSLWEDSFSIYDHKKDVKKAIRQECKHTGNKIKSYRIVEVTFK